MEPREKDFASYVFMFKLEGHSTWRTVMGGTPDFIKKEVANWKKVKNRPVMTELQVIRIDRVTGTISPYPMTLGDITQ